MATASALLRAAAAAPAGTRPRFYIYVYSGKRASRSIEPRHRHFPFATRPRCACRLLANVHNGPRAARPTVAVDDLLPSLPGTSDRRPRAPPKPNDDTPPRPPRFSLSVQSNSGPVDGVFTPEVQDRGTTPHGERGPPWRDRRPNSLPNGRHSSSRSLFSQHEVLPEGPARWITQLRARAVGSTSDTSLRV